MENEQLCEKIKQIRNTHENMIDQIDNLEITAEKIKTDIKNEAIVYQEKLKLYKNNSADLGKKLKTLQTSHNHLELNTNKEEDSERMKNIDKFKRINKKLEE